MEKDFFEEYIKVSEAGQREKSYAWMTAIGLQQVDGLKPSQYLLETAAQHIEGKITIDEVGNLLNTYYQLNPGNTDRTEEADKVSQRIAKLLSEPAFSFTPVEYVAIHRKLFEDIYRHAGQIRNYNITKKEWVLNGETVVYGTASELAATLKYDFAEEKKYSYAGHSIEEVIKHLAKFVSGLWQIHIFCEGNTRTTAVFFIKYLRTLGFKAENDIFAENAWYFRNAMVRANYTNVRLGIHETTEYLELFLRNLLLNEKNPLKNRTMHISGKIKFISKPDIESQKPDIAHDQSKIYIQKPDIDYLKTYIEKKVNSFSSGVSEKTIATILHLMHQLPNKTVFGRSRVSELTGLKSSRASELLKLMLNSGLISKTSGYGKGKYAFNNPEEND